MQTESDIINEMLEQEREEEKDFRRELAGNILIELLHKAPPNANRNMVVCEAIDLTDIFLNRLKVYR